jgi:hypothetical protein
MSTMTGAATKRVLDRVRELLGTPTVGPACLTCGAPTPQPQRRPMMCPLCGGKQVRAANLVRALREVLRERPVDGLGPQWGREDQGEVACRAGAFEALTPVLSGRTYHNEED